MPIPPNTTATTAISFTFPFTTTATAHDGVTSYDLWYQFVGSTTQGLVSVWGTGASPYAPKIFVYSDAGVTQVLQAGTGNASAQFYAIPGTNYYIRFQTNAGIPSILSVTATTANTLNIATGDLFINNDTNARDIFSGTDELNFAVVLSSTTGSVLRPIIPIVTGDQGDILDSGYMLLDDTLAANRDLVFYDTTFSTVFVTNFPNGVSNVRIVASRTENKFYVAAKSNGNTVVFTYSSLGVVGGTSFPVDTGVVSLNGFAANTTGTILYYAETGNNKDIKRWDLALNTAMSTLASGTTGMQISEMQMLKDDTLLVSFSSFSNHFIRRYNAAGTVLNTYSYTTLTNSLRFNPNTDDPNTMWVMEVLGTTGLRRYFKTDIATGTTITSFDGVVTVLGITEFEETGTFGAPSSCPLIVLRSGLSVPGGNIVIGKMTDPMNTTSTFSFTVTSSLSPTTFDLNMDEEQYFLDVPPGDYYVVEAADPNWVPIYLLSNSTANTTTFSVASGENVTVVVLNQLHAQFSGLYKIVPGNNKRSDTYFSGTGGATIVVGFPANADGPIIQDLG